LERRRRLAPYKQSAERCAEFASDCPTRAVAEALKALALDYLARAANLCKRETTATSPAAWISGGPRTVILPCAQRNSILIFFARSGRHHSSACCGAPLFVQFPALTGNAGAQNLDHLLEASQHRVNITRVIGCRQRQDWDGNVATAAAAPTTRAAAIQLWRDCSISLLRDAPIQAASRLDFGRSHGGYLRQHFGAGGESSR
jgi:hypothetical protein